MLKIDKVYGSPGTGKTTFLINKVKNLIKSGANPSDICLLAFTKKAAQEAKDRLLADISIDHKHLHGFRTIHSFCYASIDRTKYSVLNNSDLSAIAKALGVSFTFKKAEDDSMVGRRKGDKLQSIENNARIKNMSLRDAWIEFDDPYIVFEEVEEFYKYYSKYKEANRKVDFTDMLTMFLEHGQFRQYRYVIVDECQDLSKIQWMVINKISEKADTLTVVGDDDQSIFYWSGADTDHFLDMEGEETVLEQSYRVPHSVWELSQFIISKVSKRKEKHWKTTDRQGLVEYVNSPYDVDLRNGESWLMLARNKAFIDELVDLCVDQGVLFYYEHGGIVSPNLQRALFCWKKLKYGDLISKEDAINLYSFFKSGYTYDVGSKKKLSFLQDDAYIGLYDLSKNFGLNIVKNWKDAFDIPESVMVYLSYCFENGEKLSSNPRVKISTIHSAKGGEADNVLLLTDMTKQTFDSSIEEEHKVWYVAVTRAKNNLFIVKPRTKRYYEI